MNKTLLLIICDFLLLNLLALTRWDAPVTTPAPKPDAPLTANHNTAAPVSKDQDLVDVMKLSLEDEKARRDQLAEQLNTTTQALESRNQNYAQLEAEKNKLNTTLSTTQQQATTLAQQYEAAQRDAGLSKERLAQIQRDLEARESELARQKTQVAKLEQDQVESRTKIENLSVAVKVAEQEKTMLRETADTYKTQVEAERQERIKVQETTTQLAQGVGTLAVKSEDLTKEIRDNRPINANTLFNEFLANNITVRFETTRPGIFGASNRSNDARTILVSDGKDTYAIFHADDTPFSLGNPGADMNRIAVSLIKGTTYQSPLSAVYFLSMDPRIIVVPVTDEQAKALGTKVYMTTLDPFKFSEAVLIGNGGTKYEETPFKLDPTQPGFVQMKVSFFSSKRGDLVISKTGELLGIMVNKDYCAIVNNFLPTKTIMSGEDTSKQGVGGIINTLNLRVRSLPLRLQ